GAGETHAGQARPTDARVADAVILPRPVAGPSLLEVLEPEPGAPATVLAALASIGWGEGTGDRRVSPDGRWRNGVAEGQVGPWVQEEAGYLGEENRIRRRERRLREVDAALQEAQAALAAVEARRREAADAVKVVDAELEALYRLPWQALFRALDD